MFDDVLERLNDWHIDILHHNIDWGRLVLDAINELENLQKQLEIYKDLYAQELERNGLPR